MSKNIVLCQPIRHFSKHPLISVIHQNVQKPVPDQYSMQMKHWSQPAKRIRPFDVLILIYIGIFRRPLKKLSKKCWNVFEFSNTLYCAVNVCVDTSDRFPALSDATTYNSHRVPGLISVYVNSPTVLSLVYLFFTTDLALKTLAFASGTIRQ